MVMNRVGDVGLILAIYVAYELFGSIDFATMFAMAPTISANDVYLSIFGYQIHGLTLLTLFFLVGATGKSAQILLHT